VSKSEIALGSLSVGQLAKKSKDRKLE